MALGRARQTRKITMSPFYMSTQFPQPEHSLKPKKDSTPIELQSSSKILSALENKKREEEFSQEKQGEQKQEQGFIEKTFSEIKSPFRKSKRPVSRVALPVVQDEVTQKIEKIMEEGLEDAYHELSSIERQQFKIKGEEAAYAIRELFKATHVKIKKIFFLILEWLKFLPGINRYFLEQEAKIKADKILALREQYTDRL